MNKKKRRIQCKQTAAFGTGTDGGLRHISNCLLNPVDEK